VPDSLDDIVVLPKMNQPSQKGRMFQLRWVIDLISDSRRSYVNLVFKSTQGNFILVDSIPPELLSYCTIGSHFVDGRLFSKHHGTKHTFTISSSDMNNFVEAQELFTDDDFDLSFKNKNQTITNDNFNKTFESWRQHYSDISRRQLCFVQQDGPVKIVIPCFVIAATYYFNSTSLREAILSRKLESLYHSCTVDAEGHATIELKSSGNLGDAVNIARLKLDPFANQRLNLCKNHLSAKQSQMYQRIKVDFPVEQDLTITARGEMVNHDDGSKTFIVFDILSEDSQYPFKSIDIHYQKDENELGENGEGAGTFPRPRKGSSGRMSDRRPTYSYVRHLLESCTPAENPNLKNIDKKRIADKKPARDEQKSPQTVHDKDKTDLSTQPHTTGEQSVSKAEVREKEDAEKKPKFEFSIDAFIQMVLQLQDEVHTIQLAGKAIKTTVESFGWSESVVPRRTKGGTYVTLRESYDHKATNLRRCVYVTFTCMGRDVCLVEIDQANAEHIGCSTRILVSGSEINKATAEECVKDYVDEKLLEDRKTELAKTGVVLTVALSVDEEDLFVS
jgi:hypothetical protein